MMNFSYDSAKIDDGSLNQMRFELGDTLVAEAEKNAYLSDEEILVTLSMSPTFKRAKLRLVEHLLMMFSYEVTQEIREAKWELTDRAENWEKLRKRLKAELDAEDLAKSLGFSSSKMRPPIFTISMHDWR